MAALRNVLSVLHVYWTEIAEFCAATCNQRWSHAIRTKLAKNRKKRDPKKNEEKIYTKRKRLVNEKKLANSTGSTAHARDATHVVVTRYTYGLARNSVLHQIQCITPLPECATNFGASPSSMHFTRSERVLEGNRRIMRSNAQSALGARN